MSETAAGARAFIGLVVAMLPTLPAHADDAARALTPRCRTFKVRHGDSATAVAIAPSGDRFASAGSDGSVKLWNLAGKEVRTIAAHDSFASAVAFTPSGNRLASAGHDRVIKLWDPVTGKLQATLRGHDGPVTAIAFAPDGKTLVSASWDRTVRIWNIATAKEVKALKGHTLPVASVAFNGTGDTIISGSWDRSIQLWDVKSGESRVTLKLDEGLVFSAGLAADGRMVASCSGFAALRFWELPSGKERPAPKGVEGPIFHVAFSPDGRTLAAGGACRLLQLWEVASGLERAALEGPGAKTSALAFRGDGRWLAAAAEDGTIRGWELIPATPDPKAPPLSADKLRAVWSDMGGAAGAPAYRAILNLSAHADQAVPFLKEHVKPVRIAEPERIAQLLKRLDSEEFNARQQAEQEIERLAEQAGPALRKALEDPLPSLEVRRRVERLVQKLDGKMLPLEQLQAIRGIEVLENLRTREARALLTTLAAGASGRLTTEAKATLRRLSAADPPR